MSHVIVAPDSTGKKIQTTELTDGADQVQLQHVIVADPTTVNQGAGVAVANPAASAAGLITRPVAGTLLEIGVTTPAAGAMWTHVVPANRLYRLLYGKMRFVANSTAARRAIEFFISDGTDDVFKSSMDGEIFAGLNNTIYLMPGGGVIGRVNTQSNVYHIPLPSRVLVKAGWLFATLAINIQTADQFSDIRLIVEEWIV